MNTVELADEEVKGAGTGFAGESSRGHSFR